MSKIKGLGLVLAAACATELVLRLLIPSTLFFGTWFSGEIHIPNKKYGFVFKPNYDGLMFHSDGVYSVPLKLDSNGLRPPTQSKNGADILLLGGESMIFSYGLRDSETIQAVVANHLLAPARVHSMALPGFDFARNYHLYQDKLAHQINPKIALYCLYGRNTRPEYWNTNFNPWETIPKAEPEEKLFHFNTGTVMPEFDPIATALGPILYKSAMLLKLVRQSEVYLKENQQTKIANFLSGKRVSEPPVTTRSPARTLNPDLSTGYLKFQEFILRTSNDFRKKGTQVMIIFLPKASDLDSEYYQDIKKFIPPNILYADLHHELRNSFHGPTFWIAEGHYGLPAAQILGKRIADLINEKMPFPVIATQSEAQRN